MRYLTPKLLYYNHDYLICVAERILGLDLAHGQLLTQESDPFLVIACLEEKLPIVMIRKTLVFHIAYKGTRGNTDQKYSSVLYADWLMRIVQKPVPSLSCGDVNISMCFTSG